MPNNLLYTQGLAILLGEAVTLDAIEELLTDFTIVNQSEESTSWPFRTITHCCLQARGEWNTIGTATDWRVKGDSGEQENPSFCPICGTPVY